MSWECPNEVEGRCARVGGAFCKPGMKGCLLAGKVRFADGEIPDPVWPPEDPKAGGGNGPADRG